MGSRVITADVRGVAAHSTVRLDSLRLGDLVERVAVVNGGEALEELLVRRRKTAEASLSAGVT